MNLNKHNPLLGCVAFKEMLSQTVFIDPDGVATPDHIFIGANETADLPQIYAQIMPNGGVRDIGSYVAYVIVLEIRTPLIKGQVNHKKVEYILNLLDGIISEPINDIEGFLFSLSEYDSLGTEVLTSVSYASTMININVKTL